MLQLGDLKTKAAMIKEKPMSGELWTKISKKKNGLGNPKPFFGKPEETNWESPSLLLCKGNKMLKKIEKF